MLREFVFPSFALALMHSASAWLPCNVKVLHFDTEERAITIAHCEYAGYAYAVYPVSNFQQLQCDYAYLRLLRQGAPA